tara:strand:+ start:62 stop:694 length:633 start_codon:yes stop_codon:yes gene_type:complete
LAKRLSIEIKKEIVELFINNKLSIDDMSNKFECTDVTIKRHLKKELGNEKYKEIIHIRNTKNNSKTFKKEIKSDVNQNETEFFTNQESESNFVELAPIDYEIDNSLRKELSSIPIHEVELPNVVYMIVDKNIELEIKLLKDYPAWEFLPTQDLGRKTIEIYFDLKGAKRDCSKEQKVIKVPNTNVFKIVAPILISRGISRIVSAETLIAL